MCESIERGSLPSLSLLINLQPAIPSIDPVCIHPLLEPKERKQMQSRKEGRISRRTPQTPNESLIPSFDRPTNISARSFPESRGLKGKVRQREASRKGTLQPTDPSQWAMQSYGGSNDDEGKQRRKWDMHACMQSGNDWLAGCAPLQSTHAGRCPPS